MAGRRPLPVLLLLLLAAARAAEAAEAVKLQQEACRPPAARYSSKTAYELVHDAGVAPRDSMQGCRAVYLWHLLRHGTRFPSAKEITKLAARVPALQSDLAANLAAGRGSLCAGAAERMLAWRLNATEQDANRLHPRGERDMRDIARRFKQRYPDFFRDHAQPAFEFRCTDADRTQMSSVRYQDGLFDGNTATYVDDALLKFYAQCPAWEKAVDANVSARAEVDRFEKGAVFQAVLERVSKRLGYTEALHYDDVDLLWEACRYDQAWDPDRQGAWCAAFDEEDLLVFEYRADMKYYYVGGYGNAMNLQLGCNLVKDLVYKLSAFEGGSTAQRGVGYFTHSTAMHLTMARLGIGRDAQPLTADSYEAMKTARNWSISKLGPFAANIAVMLYECPKGEKHKIRMYVNEWPVAVEGCTDSDALCSWTDFKKRFSDVASSCTLGFCGRSSAARWSSTARVLAAAAVAALLVG